MTAKPALAPQATRALPADDADDGKAIPTRTVLAAGCPVGEVERMVLERVDGRRNVSDISGLLGFTTREGAMVVRRLAELGAVDLSRAGDVDIDEGWEAPSGTVPTVPPSTARSSDND